MSYELILRETTSQEKLKMKHWVTLIVNKWDNLRLTCKTLH
jgi:hypothetical protein